MISSWRIHVKVHFLLAQYSITGELIIWRCRWREKTVGDCPIWSECFISRVISFSLCVKQVGQKNKMKQCTRVDVCRKMMTRVWYGKRIDEIELSFRSILLDRVLRFFNEIQQLHLSSALRLQNLLILKPRSECSVNLWRTRTFLLRHNGQISWENSQIDRSKKYWKKKRFL